LIVISFVASSAFTGHLAPPPRKKAFMHRSDKRQLDGSGRAKRGPNAAALVSALPPAFSEALEARSLLSAAAFGAVTGFSLVDTDTGQIIAPLTTGSVVNLETLGTDHLNILANTAGQVVSVRFAFNGNGNFSTDGGTTFAAGGDDGAGAFAPLPLSAGPQALVAIPFAEADGTGERGEAVGVLFTVIAPLAPADAEGSGTVDPTPPDDIAPVVKIVSPDAGAAAAPGYYLIRAEASDADGKVSKVAYFANGALVGTVTAAPFMASWRDVPAGEYDLTAVAYDDMGAHTTSEAIHVSLRAPVGGKTYVVAPAGNDASSGSANNPFKTIERATRAAVAGDTILIRAGTYRESLDLKRSGTVNKPLAFAAETPGTVFIDGRNADGSKRDYLLKPAWEGQADYITLRGLTFRYAKNKPGNHEAAVQTGDGWRVEDCVIQKVDGNGLGVVGNNVTLLRVRAEDNGCAGIGGSGFTNALVLDCVTRRNNTKGYGGSFEGGGGKWTRADGLLIENYNAYNNDGPGLWLDIENVNATIRNSALHHNYSLYRSDGSEKIDGIGLFLEISGVVGDDNGHVVRSGMLSVEHNQIYDNEQQGVRIYATRNVTLWGNVFANNDIEFKDQRQAPYENRNIRIVNNQFQNARITADDYTALNPPAKRSIYCNSNVFDNLDGRVYRWGNASFNSLSKVRASLGFERDGIRGTVVFTPVTDNPTSPTAA
jgi:hypothetical protein